MTNQTYKETCAECHFAYQPELLPSVSWLKILNQLDDHFGEEVEADPDQFSTPGWSEESARIIKVNSDVKDKLKKQTVILNIENLSKIIEEGL